MAELNLVDTLLSKDIDTLTHKDTCTYKVESLSKKTNINFEITLQALTAKDFMRIRRQCSTTDKKGKTTMDEDKFTSFVLLEGIKNPDLHNDALCKHYKVATPAELVMSMFTVGEIGDIVTKINELSGNNIDDPEEAEEEVKN